MADYLYDVFISYQRKGLTKGWITEHFLPHFGTWLPLAIQDICDRPAQPIFFDESQTNPAFPVEWRSEIAGVEGGSDWATELRRAIRVSRCMVGIWTPTYFDSEWCDIEWQSFDRRAVQTGRRVILATKVYGKSFPKRATEIQYYDFSSYLLFGKALIDSKKYESFQDAIKHLAEQVAKAVRDAPPFEPWPLADDLPPPPPPPPVPLPRM
jgi:TIR domain